MIVVTNIEVYTDNKDKYVHRLGTDTYFKRCGKLPNDTAEMFEEVDKVPNFEKIEYYKELVSQKIRGKYSQDAELAVLRQRDEKPEEYKEYFAYAEKCKQEAKEEVAKLPKDWVRYPIKEENKE